jgi:hypothetical protein
MFPTQEFYSRENALSPNFKLYKNDFGGGSIGV